MIDGRWMLRRRIAVDDGGSKLQLPGRQNDELYKIAQRAGRRLVPVV